MAKIKNKHGRVGVKNYHPRRPLADDQKAEYFHKGWSKGVTVGKHTALLEALDLVNGARTIRDARRKIAELLNG